MLDFVSVKTFPKQRSVEIYPEFLVKKSKDLMIRGRAFYAIWDAERGMWSRSEDDARRLIDNEVYTFAESYKTDRRVSLQLLANFSSKKWTEFQTYCKSCPDNYHDLDDRITFKDIKIKKTDYVSRTVPYSLSEADCPSYRELLDVLYDPEEQKKIEWTIGAILSGDSKKIQKFVVFYGSSGSGKSTILRIMEKLFEGYWVPFDSKALGVANNSFALEVFRNNPLVAIQHDGNLSRIEDNTRINSMVSHESMMVNEKFKSPYPLEFKTFLILATNSPVKITDAKSGIIRRLIDIHPTGNLVDRDRYDYLIDRIPFEIGSIALRCLKRYEKMGAKFYDHYISTQMIGETNDFYNFIEENYDLWVYDHPEGITLNTAWLRYKEYCSESNNPYPYRKMVFKSELKNYFDEFYERLGTQYSVYKGFKKDKFNYKPVNTEADEEKTEKKNPDSWLKFDCTKSEFDLIFLNQPAQYATDEGVPIKQWSKVETTLKDIDTGKLHYVKVPENLIVIDFDIKDENGKKDYKANLEAASKWPPTYAELSKSGAGIHLHYYYDGDVNELSRIFGEDIEVKVFSGNSSLRRCLTLCNDILIATISSGLPLKERKKMVDERQIKSERGLRDLIKRSLNKEFHGHTKPEIDFIYHILDEAYHSGLKYDVRDMRMAVQRFALASSNQAEYCLKMIGKMEFCSEDSTENVENYDKGSPLVFYDVEVFPNLFVVAWKKKGDTNKVIWYNPTPEDIESLVKMKLVGFNNRKYDNHILYARMMGYTELQLFKLSQRIINEDRTDALFNEAYNLSYTDIYDFLSASNKMSLKKWEIKLGIHHLELGLPWDKPVPKELWPKVGEYCGYDVDATEAVWDANQADFNCREILALLAGLTVNDTTNQCTTKILIGDDKNAASQYVYTDLSTIFPGYEYSSYGIKKERYRGKIVNGKSIYRGVDPGEGGRVYANPGIYYDVPVLDIASMHPHSALKLGVFGKYTKNLGILVDTRLAIKHKDYALALNLLTSIVRSPDAIPLLEEYLSDPSKAKALSTALKTAINSVYGLTSARFPNRLKDPRNKDNIVAKYGALFMINLQEEVEKRGFTVVHIKTDSIKIANATPEIIQFVKDYGQQYGFTFEHESTYKKICLVNEAVYIAQYEDIDKCMTKYGYVPEKNNLGPKDTNWTATGTQFQVPYVFKKLFSHEKIEFEDLCETKSVSTALYLDMNENLPDGTLIEKEIARLTKLKETDKWTEEDEERLERLQFEIPMCHDYRFVGKVGQFCPMKSGYGGGILLRQNDDEKFSAVTGTKRKDSNSVYRWLESETVRLLHKEDGIDLSYYNAMVDDAIDTISKFGDFEAFANGGREPNMDWMNPPENDDGVPFDEIDNVA